MQEMPEIQVWFLSQKDTLDSLEKEIATLSSIRA